MLLLQQDHEGQVPALPGGEPHTVPLVVRRRTPAYLVPSLIFVVWVVGVLALKHFT